MADAPEQSPAPSSSGKKSGNSTKLIVIAVVVVAVLAVGGFALQKISQKTSQAVGEKMAEKMIETASGGKAKVDINDQGVTVKTNEGTYSSGTDLPADFPKDVPVYPGAKVTYSGTNTSGDGQGVGVMLTTADSSEKVAAYYSKELVAQGWKIESTQNVTGTTVLGASKDTRTLSVAAVSADGATNITLGVSTGN